MKTPSIIEVVGGSGGVGTSVLSTAIVVRAALVGLRSVAVDGDQLGGGSTSHPESNQSAQRCPDFCRARGPVDGAELLRILPPVEAVFALWFDRAKDVPLAAEIVRDVLFWLSVAVDAVVADLTRPITRSFRRWPPPLR